MQYYPVSYFRINNGSRAVCRYIDSQVPLLVAVSGFDDREMLNLLLAYRYVISYEPFNFKGHLTDFPLTLAYGKKIDALRALYKAWLWDADSAITWAPVSPPTASTGIPSLSPIQESGRLSSSIKNAAKRFLLCFICQIPARWCLLHRSSRTPSQPQGN